jgi:hypothetical protein
MMFLFSVEQKYNLGSESYILQERGE